MPRIIGASGRHTLVETTVTSILLYAVEGLIDTAGLLNHSVIIEILNKLKDNQLTLEDWTKKLTENPRFITKYYPSIVA